MRILVALSPRMYRQVVALFIHQQRPGHEVRVISPEATAGELESFGPHLLVRNDSDGLSPQSLGGVRFWVEIQYSDGMDAKISADHHISEVKDMSMEDLLGAIDRAAETTGEAGSAPTRD